jgi:hypothetical protein
VTFKHEETKALIDDVLGWPKAEASRLLHERLIEMDRSEPEFCFGVIEHGRGMRYTPEQWFDFLSKISNRFFVDQRWLMNMLTEEQKQQLGFEI